MLKGKKIMRRNFFLRACSSILSFLILLFALRMYPVIGFLPFYILVIAVAFGASYELAQLTNARTIGNRKGRLVTGIIICYGIFLPTLVIGSLLYHNSFTLNKFSPLLPSAALLIGIQVAIMSTYIIIIEDALKKRRMKSEHAVESAISVITACYIALFYIAAPATIIVIVTTHMIGNVLIFVGIIITAFFDICSYICGTFFARKRGILAVSPHKSMTGYWGGTLLCAGVMTFVVSSLDIIDIRTTTLALMISLTIMIAMIGDLFESALKRMAQKKDSGTLVAGRGGLLDAIDSHLIAVPSFCILCAMVL